MFDERFEVFLADTEFGKSINKQIRYRIFCLERGFEDPSAFPNGEEEDFWDDHSAHFIVREKKTGRWVATTRIIHPQHNLPVEDMDTLAPGFLTGVQRKHVGEISRFCVINKNTTTSSHFAHVSNPHLDWIGSVDGTAQFEITWGMLRALSYYGIDKGLDYSYMLITKPFSRLLKRLGIVLYQSGEMKEHRGLRAPFLVDFRESIPSVSKRAAAVKELFENRNSAYLSIAELQKTCGVRMQEQLDDCTDCCLN